jgi:hypothetical protein
LRLESRQGVMGGEKHALDNLFIGFFPSSTACFTFLKRRLSGRDLFLHLQNLFIVNSVSGKIKSKGANDEKGYVSEYIGNDEQ